MPPGDLLPFAWYCSRSVLAVSPWPTYLDRVSVSELISLATLGLVCVERTCMQTYAGLLESQRSPDLHVTTAVTSWTLESSPYNTYIVSGILFVSTCTCTF